MVVLEIRRQCFFQMLGTEDHKVVQALSSNRADKGLGVRILPGTLMRCQGFLGAQRSDSQTNLSTVDAVSVSNQIAGRFSVTERLYDLLRGPGRSGMRADAKVQHFATAMFQHDEHEQDFQADRRHGEKVDRGHLAKMVVQERLPRLTRGAW